VGFTPSGSRAVSGANRPIPCPVFRMDFPAAIPNGKVFADPVAIHSKGMHDFIWNEVAVLVTFESNWKKAKDILNEIAVAHAGHLAEPAQSKLREYARDFLIGQVDLAPKVFTTVEANGILLTVRHLCRSRHRRESIQEIWEEVLDRFAACDDVDFACRVTRRNDSGGSGS